MFNNKNTALLHTFIHEAEHVRQEILVKFALKNKNNQKISLADRKQLDLFLEADERNTRELNSFFDYLDKKGLKSIEEFDYIASDLYNKYKKAPMEIVADNIAYVMQYEIGDRNEEEIQHFRRAYRSILENGASEVYDRGRKLSPYWAIQNIRAINERITKETRRISDTGILYQSTSQQLLHEDRNLIITHASKSERLEDILASGSLVAPSMAITKKGQKELSEKHFGDILFIRDPKQINYKKDNIYDRDIYSPRMPQPWFDIPDGRVVDSYEYDSLKRSYERDPEKFKEKRSKENFLRSFDVIERKSIEKTFLNYANKLKTFSLFSSVALFSLSSSKGLKPFEVLAFLSAILNNLMLLFNFSAFGGGINSFV